MTVTLQRGWTDSFLGRDRVTPEQGVPFGEAFRAAFTEENDVLAMVELFNRPAFQANPEFNFEKRLTQSPYFPTYPEAFAGAESEEEFSYIESLLTEGLRKRQLWAGNGAAGVLGGMAGGVLSPTILLPIAGAARGARGVAGAFGYAALGGTAQESVLLAAQPARTLDESALNIATQTVLGGLLGTASVYLRPGELDDIARGMDTGDNPVYVLPAGPSGTYANSLGAAEALDQAVGAGALADRRNPFIRVLARVSGPVTQTLSRGPEHSVAQREMAKLWDAGVKLEGYGQGRVAAEGGTVHARTKLWNSFLVQAEEFNDAAYARYALKGPLARARAGAVNLVPGLPKRLGILSRSEWNHLISDAINQIPDRQIIPEVEEVAKFYVEKYFNVISKRAVDQGMYRNVTELADFVTKGENRWLTRIYRPEVMRARQADWLALLSRHLKQHLEETFGDRFTKLQRQQKLTAQDVEDLVRPRAEAEELIAEFDEQLKQIDEGNPFQELEEAISDLQDEFRAARESGDKVRMRELRDRRKELTGQEGFGEFAQTRGEIRRRRRVLARGRGNLEKRQQEALESVEKLEAQNINTLRRAAAKVQTALKRLDRVSDDRLDDEIARIQRTVDQASKQFAKNEARIEKLVRERDLEEFFVGSAAEAVEAATPTGRFHGTSRRIDTLSEYSYASLNIYGQGFYTTNSHNIATGYTRKGVGKTPTIYRVNERNENAKLYDLDSAVDDDVRSIARRELGELYSDINLDTGAPNASLREILDEARNISKSESIPADDVQARFESIQDALAKKGFRGYTHVGGARTGNEPHTVNIYWNPKDDLEIEELVPGAAPRVTPKLGEAEAAQQRGLAAEARQEQVAERLTRSSERLEAAQAFDREGARAALNETLDTALGEIEGVIGRRFVREQRLREKAVALDPERAVRESEELRTKMGEREAAFVDTLRKIGVEDYDLAQGSFDFTDAALQAAKSITNKILKWDRTRLVGVDYVLGLERGSLLSRALDIPIDTPGFKDFLERDIDVVGRTFHRTMVPDIEMFRATGSVNGSTALQRMIAEFEQRQDQILQDLNWDGKPLKTARTQEQKNKALADLEKGFTEDKVNYETVVARVRNQRGIPDDPASLGYRAGKLSIDLNTLMKMGTVVPSSVADIARPMMKFGLLRTFRDGWLPLIRNLKEMARNKDITRLSGVGVDSRMHTRAQQLTDTFDDHRRGTRFERGVNFVSSRMGLVALFDFWTDGMKFISFGPMNSTLWDALESVHQSGRRMSRADAQEVLDEYGITDRLGRRMLELVAEPGGGVRGDNGRWLPNTEDWVGDFAEETRDAYHAAIAKGIDDTIITPGPERPKWIDKNIWTKMIGQFRSFAFSSTTKTLMSGIQQRDMAVVNGAMVSLAMGAVSYYIWAVTSGGRALEEMLNAGPDKWADEAIDRSGLLGILGEVRNVGERVPLIQKGITFSGERTTRRGGEDLIGTILGPNFDLADRYATILMSLDEPTQSTTHKIRTVIPFQNVWWLRRGFDEVERGFNQAFGVPTRRQ